MVIHGGSRLASVAQCRRSCRRVLSNVAVALENRAILEVSGVDAKALLQGLMTNDVSLLDEKKGRLPSISTAFLNPKGRVLGDAMVIKSPRHEAKRKPGYLLDCPLSVAEELKTHLKLYKLRSKVKIKDATALYDVLVSGVRDPWGTAESGGQEGDPSHPVAAATAVPADTGADGRTARFADPRCAALGVRVIRPKGDAGSEFVWPGGDAVVPESRYNALRMVHGVGEGSELVDSIPLESNLDLLGSISFTKGCYVGQELTARTQFKGFVRKRVLPVLFPEEGAQTSASSVRGTPRVVTAAGDTQGLLLRSWGSGGAEATPPPKAGSKVLGRAAGDGKLGALVAVSQEYNVGLALLRLAKVLSPAPSNCGDDDRDTSGSVKPATDCRVEEEGDGNGGESRRCLLLTPSWWPVDLDQTTGKISV